MNVLFFKMHVLGMSDNLLGLTLQERSRSQRLYPDAFHRTFWKRTTLGTGPGVPGDAGEGGEIALLCLGGGCSRTPCFFVRAPRTMQ